MGTACAHVREIRPVHPSGSGCKECLEMGDTWVHPRLCLTKRPGTLLRFFQEQTCPRHFHKTHHLIVQSLEQGEDWRWCYVDEIVLE